jgi:hypothetical protein
MVSGGAPILPVKQAAGWHFRPGYCPAFFRQVSDKSYGYEIISRFGRRLEWETPISGK